MSFLSPVNQSAPLNRFSFWKYLLMGIITIVAVLYALPMVYGDSPAIQISPVGGRAFLPSTFNVVGDALKNESISTRSVAESADSILIKFSDSDTQLKAYDVLKETLGKNYVVALNLAPNTPQWLTMIGAAPMKLGLDLRGGMYFLLDVDMQSVIDNNLQNEAATLRTHLREADIRYSSVVVEANRGILLHFRDPKILMAAQHYLSQNNPELAVVALPTDPLVLVANLTPQAIQQLKQYAVEQTVTVMRNRVNELGVTEASVAQQGLDRVVIELPGLQDAARAQEIIGGTATLKVMMVNESADLQDALNGKVPLGSTLYRTANGQPYVLYDRVVITGKSVVGASSGFNSQTNLPVVNVKLSGPEVNTFSEVTGENVGHLMAIVRVNQSFTKKTVNGHELTQTQTDNTIISVASILQRLGDNFEITGLSTREAQDLALGIRAGALPAPVQIVEERNIGPSLGAENIKKGAWSVAIAMILVMVFMAIYYHLLGVVADVALILNLVLIVAIMAILPGATLSLPGIAGIVLNVGMAIDSNVLIFERIREEIRNGTSMQIAIHAGYERAFATIFDSNMTTLIVAIILCAIGTGAVKGFAVTLMIGIITSMFTSLFVARGIVNLMYGGRAVKKISIGISQPVKGS
ncbi:MAG: protein translocase subunit SecD [Gammaproteobacteria bacterium]|nr:protein translocase subunit SecD [Gammaproteobacteria bacterium]